MLFFEDVVNNNYHLDVGTKSLDAYYYKNLDFDANSNKVKKLDKVLDKLVSLFSSYKGRRIMQQEALHLVLFVNTLMNEYAPGWEQKFIHAFKVFREEVVLARKKRDGEYWLEFAMLISTSSNAPRSIRIRHEFFSKKMLEFLKPVPKDPKRSFDELEREIVYLKYNNICAVCLQSIDWDDLEIHHIKEHHFGGETIIENAVPVHRKCHPRGDEAIKFAENWEAIKAKLSKENIDDSTKEIMQFCSNIDEAERKIRLPDFPQKLYYHLNRNKNGFCISLSVSVITDIEVKDKIAIFDDWRIGNYSIKFDPAYNNNYGQISLLIPFSENIDVVQFSFIKFVNITKSGIGL
jgi:hypothetical protein